jgi:uncharacterized protein YjdB
MFQIFVFNKVVVKKDIFMNKNFDKVRLCALVLFWSVSLGYTQLSKGNKFIVDGIQYEVTSTNSDLGAVEVDDYTGRSKDVVIPSTVTYEGGGYHVRSIGTNAFRFNSLTSVVIPNSIWRIGESAFEDNELTSVNIGNGVKYIGEHSFEDNNLIAINIPDSVTTIGADAFKGNSLRGITIGARVRSIGSNAFYSHNVAFIRVNNPIPPSLGSDVFGFSIKKILLFPYEAKVRYENDQNWSKSSQGGNFFESFPYDFAVDNIAYRKINIIPGLEEVELVGYTGGSLGEVIIPRSVTYSGIVYDVTSIGNRAFYLRNLTSILIGNSVKSIGYEAVHNNRLTSVVIPNSVTSIEWSAFRSNPLENVIIGNSVTHIGAGAFAHNIFSNSSCYTPGQLTNVIIPNSVRSIGARAFRCHQLTNLSIGNSVDSIGSGAFSLNQLTSVTIPNSVGTIGSSAFSANQLTSLIIGNNVDSIGSSAFFNNKLTSVVIPNSVRHIGPGAFSNNELRSVVIPNGVEHLQGFSNNNLTSITIPNSVRNIGPDAFSNNELRSVVIPNGVEHLQGFSNNNLTSITIPNSVRNIGPDAFSNNELRSVVIPNSVTSIGWSAFRSNSLENMVIGNSVKTIGSNAFSFNQLTSVIIPNSVTTIGYQAFIGNQLTSLTIGSSVDSIGSYAFSNNTLDSVVSFSENPPILNPDVFGNRYHNQKASINLLIPSRKDSVYLARNWTGFKSRSYILSTIIPTTSLSISGIDILTVGDSFQYVATVLPNTATDTSVTWNSLTSSVVSIDQEGLLQTLQVGTGKITVTQGALVDTFTVTVKAVSTTSLFISGVDTLFLGDSSKYTATIFPANATDTSLIWGSLTPSIISINQSGFLQTLGAGTGLITATQGTLVDTFSVTVQMPTDSISIFGTDTLQLGDSYQYTADIFPTNATDTSVIWYSLTPGIVSIDSTSGLLQTLQATIGKVVVTQGSLADTLSIFIQDTVATQDTISTSIHLLPEAPQNQVVLYSIQGKRIATMKESEWNRFRSSSPISQLYFVKVYSPEGIFLKSYRAVK